MKTQILRLEAHDDVISARDKMGWGQTSRILLVWPEDGQVLTRKLDLVLLHRHSIKLGAQLALVTSNGDVKYHARHLGIPVYKSLRQAQNINWRIPRRTRRGKYPYLVRPKEKAISSNDLQSERPENQPLFLPVAARIGIFALGILAVLTLTVALLPSATIALVPRQQDQEIRFNVQADPRFTSINLSGAVPSHTKSVIVEGRLTVPTSGTIGSPDKAAVGWVEFTNLTDQPVEVPKGTVVTNAGPDWIRFVTTQGGVSPASSDKKLSLPIVALTPGSQGNLLANRVVGIEGFLGTQLTAINPLSISGGKDRIDRAPSDEDRTRLYEQLFESLRRTALQELQNGLASDDLLLTENPTLLKKIEAIYEPATPQPADQLSLDLRLEFQAPYVSGKDLRYLATTVLDGNLPPGFSSIHDSLQIDTATKPVPGSGSLVTWELVAHRKLQATISQSQATALSLGVTPSIAMQRLSAFLPLESQPNISLAPAWWPRLPLVPMRIAISLINDH
jgi:hypothetical protein